MVTFRPNYLKKRDIDSIGWGLFSLLLTVHSVDDEKITCQIIRKKWVNTFDGSEFSDLPPRKKLGGLSGAPLWTLLENPIFSWRLAGIIKEFHEDYEILIVMRPNCINPDGTIKRR